MAYFSMFKNDHRPPEGIFAGIYDNFCENHEAHVKQAKVDRIMVNYAVIPEGFRFMFRKNGISGFSAMAMNSWLGECETGGCISVYDSGSILVFDKNVKPSFIRPRIALRYFLRGKIPDSLFRKPEMADICSSELETVLAKTDTECEQYISWLVAGSKIPVPYASELLTYMFPTCIEVFEHDTIMSDRKKLNLLIQKLKGPELPRPLPKQSVF